MFSDILLTVDYDRTLTAPDSTIPERNLEAIRYFIDNGGTFTVNTGRSLPMTKVFRDVVPVNAPLLLYNGAAAYDLQTGEFTECHTIPLPMEQTIREIMASYPDLMVELQGIDAHYAFRENPGWDAYLDHNLCARGHADPGDDLGPFLKFSLYGEFREVTVADLFAGSPEEVRRMDEAEEQLRRQFGDHCEVFRAASRIIDIQTRGISKKRAARDLQHRLGKRILVCVGDGENDIPMLRDADFAFCPGDAIVSDRFENVCGCAEGSVADVIYKKIPEILEKTIDNQA